MTGHETKLARRGRKREDGGVAYLITNTIDGKRYVGITTRPARRWREHLWAAARGERHVLHRAMALHGPEAFTCSVIACAPTWDALCETERTLVEQYGTHVSGRRGCNMTIGGDGHVGHGGYKWSGASLANHARPMQGRTHSAETRRKISEACKGKPSVMGMLGKRHSDETRARMSAVAAGRPKSEETKRRMSEAAKLRGRRPSERCVRKAAASNAGRPGNKGMLGRTMSDEAKERISAALRGRVLSEETKARMSKARRARHQR